MSSCTLTYARCQSYLWMVIGILDCWLMIHQGTVTLYCYNKNRHLSWIFWATKGWLKYHFRNLLWSRPWISKQHIPVTLHVKWHSSRIFTGCGTRENGSGWTSKSHTFGKSATNVVGFHSFHNFLIICSHSSQLPLQPITVLLSWSPNVVLCSMGIVWRL